MTAAIVTLATATAALIWATVARIVLVHQRKRDLRSAYLDSRDEPADGSGRV